MTNIFFFLSSVMVASFRYSEFETFLKLCRSVHT
uniref:Uncharacterized protein n=1 Tax=Anguilla anguilla TaxID=7936 RepID=A0A0E9WKH0_ANGAN